MLIFGFLILFVAVANSVQSTLYEPDKTIYVLTESLTPFLCVEALFFLIIFEVASVALYQKDSLLFSIIHKAIRIIACITLISIALSINTYKIQTPNALGTTSVFKLQDINEIFDKDTFLETVFLEKKEDTPDKTINDGSNFTNQQTIK
ncbi:hypothetical protein [Pseudoalteromonas marina]|uniref:Transmembrane protein n=1 Tax=Pseudoalteromonas marina TaxID=267375 RepID=A0ABT9FGG1_9GAMM|nr:hypothetical protein [Pseudoalteromonas marina]MDP2565872.1 hypothetical protein [Pseudoalteromonas marina]